MPTRNVYVVRPDGTPDNNYIDTDTVSGIAVEWLRQNRNQTMFRGRTFAEKQERVIAWIEHRNRLENLAGVECDGTSVQGGIIRVGQSLTLPAGNAVINPPQHRVPCPIVVPVAAPDEPTPAVDDSKTRIRVVETVREVPQHQLIVNSRGTVRDAVGLDAANYFLGRHPRDAAAQIRGRSDQLNDGLNPGNQEGTLVNTSRSGRRGEGVAPIIDALGVPFGGLADSPRSRLVLSRSASNRENEFRPEQHIRLGADGEPIGPNKRRNNQKMESGVSLDVDADGEIRTTQNMGALISINRRNDPNHRGFIREVLTARTRNGPLTNTGEGLMLDTTLIGAENDYAATNTRFTANPNAADAERLLQLNVQMAMHPLLWSLDSYGAPVNAAASLRTDMSSVIERLPAGADRDRLTATYVTPYAPVMDDPVALNAAIAANGGRETWVNPMHAWRDQRLEQDYDVVRNYGRVPTTQEERDAMRVTIRSERAQARANGTRYEGGSVADRIRRAEAERVGTHYANQMWNESVRPPREHETALGTGLLHDAEGQREANLAPARIELLEHLRSDPVARAAWIDHMLATPGGMQNVSDLLHFSSNTRSGNSALLGFANGREAAGSARSLATSLAGEEQGRGLMHRNAGALDGVARFLTIGIANPGTNRNQNNGLFGFQEATAERWNNPATRAEVDAAMTQVLDRSITTARAGGPVGQIAATSLVLTMDPDRASENARSAQTHTALFAKLSPTQTRVATNQMVVNLDNAGDRYVSAAVARATKAGLLNGEAIRTVDAATANRAVDASNAITAGVVAGGAGTDTVVGAGANAVAGGTVIGGADPVNGAANAGNAGARTVRVTALTMPDEARVAAIAAGGSAARAGALATTTNASQTSQNQLNAFNATRMAAASPAAFASVVTSAIVAGDAATAAAVNAMNNAQGRSGDELANLINRQVSAINAAGNSPAANAAAGAAFSSFFAADGSRAAQNALAAGALAGSIGSNPAASNAVNAAAQSVLAGLPAAEQDRVLAIGAITDPTARLNAINAFAAQNAGHLATINARWGISIVETVKMVIAIDALTRRPDQPDNPDLPERPVPGEPPIKGCCDVPTTPTTPGLPEQPVPSVVPVDKVKPLAPVLPVAPPPIIPLNPKLLPLDLPVGTNVAPLGTGGIPSVPGGKIPGG